MLAGLLNSQKAISVNIQIVRAFIMLRQYALGYAELNQKLENLLPSYGEESKFQVSQGEIAVDLGPGRIHVFEIDTPYIESYTKKVYKQH